MGILSSIINAGKDIISNSISMGREDNAVQRRVADLKAAGLSPVLAAGSAANSSPYKVSDADMSKADLVQMSQSFASKDEEINLMKNQNKSISIDNKIKDTDLKMKQLEYDQMLKDFNLFGTYRVGSWTRDVYGLHQLFTNKLFPNFLSGGEKGSVVDQFKNKVIKPVVKPLADTINDVKDRDWLGDISDSFGRFNKRFFNFGNFDDGLNFF